MDDVDYVEDLSARAPRLRLTVLAEPTSSPTTRRLRGQLRERFPNLRWVTYQPEGEDPELLGLRRAVGRPVRPHYRFSQAETIVSLDADFLGPTDPAMVRNTQEFSRSRRIDPEEGQPEVEMSRLYVIESQHSITGGMADHRMSMRASDIPALAAALAAKLLRAFVYAHADAR